MTGLLPDSDAIAREAARIRANVAWLAARNLANIAVKHALECADVGNLDAAAQFDATAKLYRSHELAWAADAGIADDDPQHPSSANTSLGRAERRPERHGSPSFSNP